MSIPNKERERIALLFSGSCHQKNICPVKDITATFSDKWSMYVVLLLGQHNKLRFNELRGTINGISQRMLTVTLRSLEENGILSRSIYPGIPMKVEYQLTILGQGLLKQILALTSWSEENSNLIIKARSQYDKEK